MFCAIECKAKDSSGKSLYLTDDFPKVRATVQQNGQFREGQLWLILYNPNTGGVCIKNKSSNNLIGVPRGGNPAVLIPDSLAAEKNLDWPSAVLSIVDDNNDFRVIRGLKDENNNLDIAGGGPYKDGAEVLFWGWEGNNNDNYFWKFIPVSV